MFSYSGRVKSPEWRWQWRRADLRHLEIFRHRPVIIYTRLPAGGTYYPICTFLASSECLIGISDAFSAFCLRVSVIFPTCSLYPQQKCAYSALHPQAWTYIYRGPCPKAVPWISEDRLLASHITSSFIAYYYYLSCLWRAHWFCSNSLDLIYKKNQVNHLLALMNIANAKHEKFPLHSPHDI